MPFADVVAQLNAKGITVDQNSTFSYVIATATQANSLNQDLNGVGGNYDGNATWSTLGVITDPLTAGGVPAPEPGTAVASALIAAAAIVQSQVRRKARRL